MNPTRADLREAARAALGGADHFESFRKSNDWGRNRDARQLPAIGVFTPQFRIIPTGVGHRRVEVDLTVLVRREGGDDLEDLLDADAEQIEAAVLPALEAICEDVELASGENDVPGIGEKRIGTMVLTFRCNSLTQRL